MTRGGHRASEASRARIRALFLSKTLLENLEPWVGPVERLADLGPTRRVALGLAPVERRRSEVMIRLCRNPFCRHWTPTRLPECVVCHTRHMPRIPITP